MKKTLSFLLTLCLIVAMISACGGGGGGGGAGAASSTIVISGKSFTEALLISEIVAQLLEAKTDLKVERKYDMSASLCFQGLVTGDLDFSAEYTSSMLLVYLKEETQPGDTPAITLERVKKGMAEQFGITILSSMGFNNTYGLMIMREFAEANNIRTYSDLIPFTPQMRFGAEHSFYDREDGFEVMAETYGFQFAREVKMDVALKYVSMAQGQIDASVVYTTDGQISEFDIVILEDDKFFFPDYYMTLAFRTEILERHPEIAEALAGMDGIADEADIIRFNSMVDNGGMSIPQVAAEFIREFGLN